MQMLAAGSATEQPKTINNTTHRIAESPYPAWDKPPVCRLYLWRYEDLLVAEFEEWGIK